MKQFTIYKHPDNRIIAVKQGWSWPAFVLCSIWAYVKKLYKVGSITLILTILCSIIVGTPEGEIIFNILSLILMIWFGIYGNELLGDGLLNRGFDKFETIDAKTSDAAIAIFIRGKNTPENKTEPFISM